MKVRLVCIDPLCPEDDVVLDRFPAVIGRGPDADVRLRDGWASRVHCVLDVTDDMLVVRDCSRHGTLVNGMPVEESPLQPDDTLCVGDLNVSGRLQPPLAQTAVLPRRDATACLGVGMSGRSSSIWSGTAPVASNCRTWRTPWRRCCSAAGR